MFFSSCIKFSIKGVLVGNIIALCQFCIFPRDVNERMQWVEAISAAVEELRTREATFQVEPPAGRMVSQSSVDISSGPNCSNGGEENQLGNTAPVWVPDGRVTMCQVF